MDYRVVFSPSARDDRHDLVTYIAADSPSAAERFGMRIVSDSMRLGGMPEMGRLVPEFGRQDLRELAVRPYRIVYRVKSDTRLDEVVRVWHAARGVPEI
jgi:toxin ParE1/3/4